jgi:hypothetical protein
MVAGKTSKTWADSSSEKFTKRSRDTDIIDIDDDDQPPVKTQCQSQAGPSTNTLSTAVLSTKAKGKWPARDDLEDRSTTLSDPPSQPLFPSPVKGSLRQTRKSTRHTKKY